MQNQTHSVFISSNSVEVIGLHGEPMAYFRLKVKEALDRRSYKTIEMSDFPASTLPPEELSAARVNDGEIFIGLVGSQYGSIRPGHAKSVTEEEFDAAEASGKVIHMYVPATAFPVAPNPFQLPRPDADTLRFITHIQERHTCASYRDPSDLPAMALADLDFLFSGGDSAAQGVFAIEKGKRELEVGNYPSAAYDLGWAVHMLPQTGVPAFILVLALLRGVRPKLHTLDEIRQIENYLHVAEQISPSKAIFALHSAIEYDYYVRNGFRAQHEQSVLDLRGLAYRCTDPDEYNMKLIRRFQTDLANDHPELFGGYF